MALRTAAVDKREVPMSETQVFSPPNLSDAAEIRAARTWLRSRRRMLDARNTSITFLPLSDGEQLTLRNQLDSRSKQPTKAEDPETAQPKKSKAQSEAPGKQALDRSNIEKIHKLWEVKDNDKCKEIREEVKLRPGRKLAAGTYEIAIRNMPSEQEIAKYTHVFRVHIPKGCPIKAKVILVLAPVPGNSKMNSGYARHMTEFGSESKEKFIVVTVFSDNQFVSNDLVKKDEQQNNPFENDSAYMALIIKFTVELTNASNDREQWRYTAVSDSFSILPVDLTSCLAAKAGLVAS